MRPWIAVVILVASTAQGASLRSLRNRVARWKGSLSSNWGELRTNWKETYPDGYWHGIKDMQQEASAGYVPFLGEQGWVTTAGRRLQDAFQVARRAFPGYDVLGTSEAPGGIRLEMVPRPGRLRDIYYCAFRDMHREFFSLIVPATGSGIDRAAIESQGLQVERAFSAPLSAAEITERDWIRAAVPLRDLRRLTYSTVYRVYDHVLAGGGLKFGAHGHGGNGALENSNGDLLLTVMLDGNPHYTLVARPKVDATEKKIVVDVRRENGPFGWQRYANRKSWLRQLRHPAGTVRHVLAGLREPKPEPGETSPK